MNILPDIANKLMLDLRLLHVSGDLKFEVLRIPSGFHLQGKVMNSFMIGLNFIINL